MIWITGLSIWMQGKGWLSITQLWRYSVLKLLTGHWATRLSISHQNGGGTRRLPSFYPCRSFHSCHEINSLILIAKTFCGRLSLIYVHDMVLEYPPIIRSRSLISKSWSDFATLENIYTSGPYQCPFDIAALMIESNTWGPIRKNGIDQPRSMSPAVNGVGVDDSSTYQLGSTSLLKI